MYHRFDLGGRRAVMVSDGPLRLARPHRIFRGVEPAALTDALVKAGHPGDRIFVQQNCLLLETGGGLALFDNGMGSDTMFGAEAGRLLANLRAAGIDPAAITALVLTHAHSDHCWGTMGDDGTPNFPNATINLAREELAFWEDGRGADDISLAGVRKHLFPLRDRIVTVRDGEAFLPGVTAWLTPGHTPGHLAFLLDGGACVTGDVAFHDPLSYLYPESGSAYDTDPNLGVATRRGLLERLAAERLMVIGYHHPWPGLGRVELALGSYRFIAGG
jgi:glyoxylase-like metal-dependent hydrolase (beta-lactamase superfamily II)